MCEVFHFIEWQLKNKTVTYLYNPQAQGLYVNWAIWLQSLLSMGPGSFIEYCIISVQHILWTITWACRGTPYKDLTLNSNISAFKVNAQKTCQKMYNTQKCDYMLQNYSYIPPIWRSKCFE